MSTGTWASVRASVRACAHKQGCRHGCKHPLQRVAMHRPSVCIHTAPAHPTNAPVLKLRVRTMGPWVWKRTPACGVCGVVHSQRVCACVCSKSGPGFGVGAQWVESAHASMRAPLERTTLPLALPRSRHGHARTRGMRAPDGGHHAPATTQPV